MRLETFWLAANAQPVVRATRRAAVPPNLPTEVKARVQGRRPSEWTGPGAFGGHSEKDRAMSVEARWSDGIRHSQSFQPSILKVGCRAKTARYDWLVARVPEGLREVLAGGLRMRSGCTGVEAMWL